MAPRRRAGILTGAAALVSLLAVRPASSTELSPVLALVPAESTTALEVVSRELLSLGPADVAGLADRAVGPGFGAAHAQMAVHGLAVLVAQPGLGVKRSEFVRAIAGRVGAHADRPEAVEFLVQQVWLAGGEDAVAVLARLKDDPRTRECAARHLSALESSGKPGLAAKALKEAEALDVTSLVRALGSSLAPVRVAARNDLLFGAGPEAEGEMARLLSSVSPRVRAALLSILGSRVAVAQADRIAPYAEDPDPCVRAEARKALYARFGMPDPGVAKGNAGDAKRIAPTLPALEVPLAAVTVPVRPDMLARIGMDNPAGLVEALRACIRNYGLPIEKDLESRLAEAEVAVGPPLPCEEPLACGKAGLFLKTALEEAKSGGVLASGDPRRIGQAVRWAYREEIRRRFGCALEKSPDAFVRIRAEHMIRELDLTEGYITAWRVSGPYLPPGISGTPLVDAPLPPECPVDKAEWQPFDAGGIDNEPGEVNLQGLVYTEEGVAILKARIRSDAGREALLLIGSDDGVKIWLNGKLVHRNPVLRSLVLDNDVVRVRLNKGWNPLLVKVTQTMGEWGVSVRLRASDGGRLAGVHSAP